MKRACFQNTLRKGNKKKKKALHRGTFEVVKIFSFPCLAPERERERERAHTCLCLAVRRQGRACSRDIWACKPCAQGQLRAPGSWHASARACVWLCTCLWLCTQWLESVRGRVSLCWGLPSRQLARGSPPQLHWTFQPKVKGPCLVIPLPVMLLGLIL